MNPHTYLFVPGNRPERFAKALRKESGLPVHLVDESMSSRDAEERGVGSGTI